MEAQHSMFDRFDIMEAWHLFLDHNHGGQGSERYARLSKLRGYFKPRPNLSFSTMSDNGQQIYMDLLTEGTPELLERPIADEWGFDKFYLMWVCAHAPSYVYINASSFDSAVEALIEWCDDHCIGAFTGIGREEYEDAAEDLKLDVDEIMSRIDAGEYDDEEVQKVIEHAECDMMMVGHTTLSNWDYSQGMPGIPSWEWGGNDVECEASCEVLKQRIEDEEDDE